MSHDRRGPCFTALCLSVALILGMCRLATGQAPNAASTEEPLYQQQPFDVLVLKRDGSRHKIEPLDLPMRKIVPPAGGYLRFRLLDDPSEELAVRWTDVERVELFEQLVLAEARRLTAAKQFNEAFRHLALLSDRHPYTEGLNAVIEEYLFARAADDASAKRWDEALAGLEELYRRNANFQSPSGTTVLTALATTTGNCLDELIAKNDFRSARRLLARLTDAYGDERLPSLVEARRKLVSLAEQRAARARELAAANKLFEAQQAAREALSIWPRSEGGVSLLRELLQRYPVLTVGVAEKATRIDPNALADWAARRVGRLLEPQVVQFLAPGPEGGLYRSPLGRLDRSDDYKLLTLQLAQRFTTENAVFTAYHLSHILLELARPDQPNHLSMWAELVESIRADGMLRVEATLNRPFVLPEALLREPLSNSPTGAAWKNRLQLFEKHSGDGDLVLVRKSGSVLFELQQGPAEIHERHYADTRDAIDDLQGGKIWMLDRLFPADAVKLRASGQPDIVVRPYAMPTLHMLVPNYRHAYLANPTFRRALVHAIPRAAILARLYDDKPVPGCRVLSGPLPAPAQAGDAAAYAYDESLPEQPFDPGMALILVGIAKQQLKVAAEMSNQSPPTLEPLVLAYPDETIARFIVTVIAQQLERLEIPCRLQPIVDGQDTSWDLLYVSLTMEEPLVDVIRLFGSQGIVPSPNPYVQLALRRLFEATNWRDVRRRLQDLHQIMYADATVIPLFQTVEFYAHHSSIQGVGENIVTLYQNVADWKIQPQIIVEE